MDRFPVLILWGVFVLHHRRGVFQKEDPSAISIRVAVIPLNDRESLFVKMTASKPLIDAEVQRFDQFVQSLQWQ